MGGGSRGAPGVVSRGASSPPIRPRSSETGGGSVSGRSSVERERASVSSAPSGAGEGEVARSRRTPPARAASSVASPHSSQHALRRVSWGKFRRPLLCSILPCVPFFGARDTEES